MSTNLAQTLFATGKDDKLAAINVYTQQTAVAPINDSVDAILADIDTLSELSGCESISPEEQIKNVVASEEQALKSSDIVKGVISANSGLHSAYSSMSSKLQNFLTNVKGSVNLSVVNGQVKAGLKMATMTDAGAVTAMLNIVGGNKNDFSLKDVSGQRAFVSNLLKLSSTMGVPGAYATAMSGIADKTIGRNITRDILPTVIANSSHDMLRDIAQGPHAGHVRATYPNLNRDFASAFRFPHGTPTNKHADIGSSILSSFNLLNPNWNRTRTSKGKDYFNGNISLNSSGDFKAAMKAMGAGGFGGFNYSSTERVTNNTIPNINRNRVVKYTAVDDNGNPVVRYSYPNGTKERYYTGSDGNLQKEMRVPKRLAVDGENLQQEDNSAIDDAGTMCHILNDADEQSRLLGGSVLNSNASTSLKNAFPFTSFIGSQDVNDSWFS